MSLTVNHARRLHGIRADGTGRDDCGGAALARIHAGDRSAVGPTALVSALKRAANVRVRVLNTGLSVVARGVGVRGRCAFKIQDPGPQVSWESSTTTKRSTKPTKSHTFFVVGKYLS